MNIQNFEAKSSEQKIEQWKRLLPLQVKYCSTKNEKDTQPESILSRYKKGSIKKIKKASNFGSRRKSIFPAYWKFSHQYLHKFAHGKVEFYITIVSIEQEKVFKPISYDYFQNTKTILLGKKVEFIYWCTGFYVKFLQWKS